MPNKRYRGACVSEAQRSFDDGEGGAGGWPAAAAREGGGGARAGAGAAVLAAGADACGLGYTGRMKTSEERRWERLQQQLAAEATGKAPVRLCSQRTLFGIPSHVDEVIGAVVAEENRKCADALRERRGEADG